MVVIRKKNTKSTLEKLITKSTQFIYLLEGQKEDEAISDLKIAINDLKKHESSTEVFKTAMELLIQCFEGEHDLLVYTQTKESQKDKWGDAEELYLASSEVYNLAKRISKTISA